MRWWGGSGISWTICKSFTPHSKTPVPHHSLFTGWMPFLLPNQQCQSTEGRPESWQSLSNHQQIYTLRKRECAGVGLFEDIRRRSGWWVPACVQSHVNHARRHRSRRWHQSRIALITTVLCLWTGGHPSRKQISRHIRLMLVSADTLVAVTRHWLRSTSLLSWQLALVNSENLHAIINNNGLDLNKNQQFRPFRPLPSVLWHCWLGGRMGIRPVKNGGIMEVGTG